MWIFYLLCKSPWGSFDGYINNVMFRKDSINTVWCRCLFIAWSLFFLQANIVSAMGSWFLFIKPTWAVHIFIFLFWIFFIDTFMLDWCFCSYCCTPAGGAPLLLIKICYHNKCFYVFISCWQINVTVTLTYGVNVTLPDGLRLFLWRFPVFKAN